MPVSCSTAVDERSPRHGPARDWVKRTLWGSETVGLVWLVLVAFVRISAMRWSDPLA